MAMSRRKQLHPKSLKEGDETSLSLPDELKCDEESNEIRARIDIEQGHRFGPYPATSMPAAQPQQQRLSTDSDSTNASSLIMQIDNDSIEQRAQSFQLLDAKHNWLSRCSIGNSASANLEIQLQDDQISAVAIKAIPSDTRLCSSVVILPKLNQPEESPTKPTMTCSTDDIKVKEEPMESEETQHADVNSSNVKSESPQSTSKSKEPKKAHPLVFTCDDCGIRYSNRSTLDAHRQHYCTKREITTKSHSTDSSTASKTKSMKRKHVETSDSLPSPSPPTKRLSLSSQDAYCSECDILFSKPDNLLQHKLHYCRTKFSTLQQINEENLANAFRPALPFDRPIQIGHFIYVPIPILSSQMENHERALSPINTENENNQNKPLDLSKPKRSKDENDQRQKSTTSSATPLDLSMEKSTNLFNILSAAAAAKTVNAVQPQIYECDFCSIRFSSLKTLHAHQENYCVEFRKQKKSTVNLPALNSNATEMKSLINDPNRSQSPPVSSSTISKSRPLSPNESLNASHLPPHRASPYMCRLCKYRGNTLRGMRMHFKFHLSNNEPCSDDDIIITSTINNTPATLPITSTSLTAAATNTSASPFLLKCTICSAMFEHEETLINHIKCVHTKENLLECLECQSRFCSKWNLLRHMKLTHTNIKCDEEEQDEHNEQTTTHESQLHAKGSTTEQNLDEDQDLSSPHAKCSDPVNLSRHVLLESMDVNSIKKLSDGILIKKKFACPYCHIKFGSIDTLKQHMSNYCASRPANDEASESKKKTNDTYCSACQIPFRHKSSYDAHKMYYCRGSNKAHVKMQA